MPSPNHLPLPPASSFSKAGKPSHLLSSLLRVLALSLLLLGPLFLPLMTSMSCYCGGLSNYSLQTIKKHIKILPSLTSRLGLSVRMPRFEKPSRHATPKPLSSCSAGSKFGNQSALTHWHQAPRMSRTTPMHATF